MVESEWLEIGRIVAPQGLRGEVRVYPNSDFPERFEQPGDRWLRYPGATEPEPIRLVSGRFLSGKGLYVVQFEGIRDRTQAEALRDCQILVPEGDRPALEEDEFHVLDLLGLKVIDQATQTPIGVVVDVIAAGNDLLEVQLNSVTAESPETAGSKRKSANVLIPFVRAIVPVVDLEQRHIEITPPAGLIE